MARLVFLGTGLVSIVVGIVLIFRPDATAQYHDALSTRETSVSGAFGVATSRLNGVLFVFVGAWLLFLFVTS